MSNSGVIGVIQNGQGVGVSGLVATVRRKWNTSDFTFELGSGTSNANGSFDVRYAAVDDPFLQLEVELTDLLGRRVAPRRLFTTVTAQTLDTGPWVVPNAESAGWVATGGAFAPTAGNRIEVLMDNEAAWAAVIDAVQAARTSIDFMLFFLDVGHAFLSFPFHGGVDQPGPGKRLENVLKDAGIAGVTVRILVNDFSGTFCFDTADDVAKVFRGATGIETRQFRSSQLAPMHGKVLIVRSPGTVEAYVLGSPFVQDYFDDTVHSLRDARHGEKRLRKQINVPVHDVSLRLRGPVIQQLDETFRLHWNHAKPTAAPDLAAAPAPPAETGNLVTAQVTRTLSGGGFFTARPEGETSIYESYLRAIANAQRYVYLENQYFTCRELAQALARAVKDNTDLQVILVTNNKVDIPLYSSWHPTNVTRLLTGLTVAERKRVGVFTLWTHGAGVAAGKPDRVGRIYTHSKVAIVDDQWATVGSANLDGVSLILSEHADRLSRPDVRETDVNVVVLGALAGGTSTDFPGQLRKKLWAEHLGFFTAAGLPNDAAVELQAQPTVAAGGWLGLWNQRVAAKLGSLLSTPVTRHPARVLPWPHKDGVTVRGISDAAAYLEACDVKPSGNPPSFEVAETFDFFDFETNQWV